MRKQIGHKEYQVLVAAWTFDLTLVRGIQAVLRGTRRPRLALAHLVHCQLGAAHRYPWDQELYVRWNRQGCSTYEAGVRANFLV